eukprot:7084543-Prorocentrum_lima.AAC.1
MRKQSETVADPMDRISTGKINGLQNPEQVGGKSNLASQPMAGRGQKQNKKEPNAFEVVRQTTRSG